PREAGTKSAVVPDGDELARQLRLAQRYQAWNQTDRALLLLREWVVSRCVSARPTQKDWLDHPRCREPLERAIRALGERQRAQANFSADEGAGREATQARLPGLFQAIGDRRNRIAHAGMTPELVRPDRVDVN